MLRIVKIARISSVRFCAYYYLGFSIGYGNLSFEPVIACLGIAYCVWFCVAVELLNRYTDRAEDRINQPERTRVCLEIGYGNICRMSIMCWLCVVTLGIILVCFRPAFSTAIVIIVTLLIGYSYSAGPEFNRHPVISLIVLTTALSFPPIAGRILAPIEGRQDWRLVILSAVLLTLASLSLAGIKDITDVAGDRLRGYRSLWLAIIASGKSGYLILTIVAIQVVLIVGVVAVKGMTIAGLICLAIPIIEITLVKSATQNLTQSEREMLRETMHTSTFIIAVICFSCLFPSKHTLIVSLVAASWWVVASKRLHWHKLFSCRTFIHTMRLIHRGV